MVSLTSLWLPILLAGVGVFVASSIIHMLLGFWHNPDYWKFSNEDAIGDAIRKGNPKPGMYKMPYCDMSEMGKPETKEKFARGPVAMITIFPNGMPGMGGFLGKWFGYCVLVSFLCAYIAVNVMSAGAPGMQVLRIVSTIAFMTYGFSSVPYGIWWGTPWRMVFKDMVDGLVYGLVTGAVFMWLWPAA